MIIQFSLKEVSSSPIRSDPKKLNFFNRHYLRQKWRKDSTREELARGFRAHIRQDMAISDSEYPDSYLDQVIDSVLERVTNFSELKEYGYFFAAQPESYNEKDLKKMFGPQASIDSSGIPHNCDPVLLDKNLKVLHNLRLIFEHILSPAEYTEAQIAEKISEFLFDNAHTLKNEDVFHLLRMAVTGRKSGVNIVKVCAIVGQKRVQSNLVRLHDLLKQSHMQAEL